MAQALNSVQESIKLALDAADAATDVTSEYSQVKREHKKLEQNVSYIHRYTTMVFITAIVTSLICLVFSAALYFKSLSELRAMSQTNREGLVVFTENIGQLNMVLEDMNKALEQQAELIALNKASSDKMSAMMAMIEENSTRLTSQMKATASAVKDQNQELSKSWRDEVEQKSTSQSKQLHGKLAGIESSLNESMKRVEEKLINNSEINALIAAQKQTAAQIEMLTTQNMEIRKLLEIQHNRVSFP